jgi:hypothetical protein
LCGVSGESAYAPLEIPDLSLIQSHSRSILGPTLGGALAKPVVNYPYLFPEDSIWAKFPYLLPNLVCTLIVACGVVIGVLFLEETHAEKNYRRDIGLEAGKWLTRKFRRSASAKPSRCEKVGDLDLSSLLGEDQPPGYRTTEGSPNLPPKPSPEPSILSLDLNDTSNMATRSKPAATRAFTRQVVLNIVGYGILA